jgi:DUF1365 family protein
VLGHVFNPVSFWLCHDAQGALRVVIAEVTNTFGDRHSYLCHRDDLGRSPGDDTLRRARSSTSRRSSRSTGRLPVPLRHPRREDRHLDRLPAPERRVSRHLTGTRAPLTTARSCAPALRRPFGSRRVLGLIHWQALKLWWKGARYHGASKAAAHPSVSR